MKLKLLLSWMQHAFKTTVATLCIPIWKSEMTPVLMPVGTWPMWFRYWALFPVLSLLVLLCCQGWMLPVGLSAAGCVLPFTCTSFCVFSSCSKTGRIHFFKQTTPRTQTHTLTQTHTHTHTHTHVATLALMHDRLKRIRAHSRVHCHQCSLEYFQICIMVWNDCTPALEPKASPKVPSHHIASSASHITPLGQH